MCTGKTLNFPDVLQAVYARKTFPAVESQYSQRNLKETYLKDGKMMSGFTTMDHTNQDTNDDGVLTQVNTEDHGDHIQR